MSDGPQGWPYSLLPPSLRAQLARRHELRAALANLNWLFAARLFEMAVALLTGAIVARYLGPERYGTLSYLLAFYALFEVCSNLGVHQIGMREVVSGEVPAARVLGTSLALRASAAACAMLAFLATLAVFQQSDPTLLGFGLVLAAGHVLSTPDTLALWFQAKVKSKYVVLARSGTKLGFVLLKLGLVALGASLGAFVLALAGEVVTSALLVTALFLRHADVSPRSFSVDARLLRRLLAEGWPLTVSAFMMMVYARIDQVMLGDMLGAHEVGIYTAAVRISEGLYALPSMLLASVLPALIAVRTTDPARYRARLQLLYDALIWGGFAAALLLSSLAVPLVVLLFGEAFRASGHVLVVHIWAIVLIFPGTATHRYLMLESQTRISLLMSVSGALVNLAANLVLIPRFGALGAAWATLLSHLVGNVLATAVFRGARPTLGFVGAALRPVRVVRRWRALSATAF